MNTAECLECACHGEADGHRFPRASEGGDAVATARSVMERHRFEHVVLLATRPKTLIGPLFSRYEPGLSYGTHVDDARWAGLEPTSPAEAYEGGGLMLKTAAGAEGSRPVASLPTRHLFASRCSRPQRQPIVAAGWVRSLVRDPAHREQLGELDPAHRRLFDRESTSAEGDLPAKCTANLIRQWCED